MAAKYTRDSIDRALMHHSMSGVVHTYSPPEPAHHDPTRRAKWRIVFEQDLGATIEVNSATAYAVCLALGAAERVHRRTA